MEDQICQACLKPRVEPRPVNLKFAFPPQIGMAFTGPREVLRQDHMRGRVLDHYKSDLEVMLGTRVQGHKFNHTPQKCSRLFH